MTSERPSITKALGCLRIGRAVRLVWESAPRLTIGNGMLLAVQGILPLLAVYLMKLIVDSITVGIANPDKTAFARVVLLIGIAGCVALAGAVCSSLSRLVGEAQSHTVTDHVQDVLHAKSVELDLEYYENAQYYDVLHRAQREAPFRPTRIVHGLSEIFQNGISLVAMAALLVSLHWFLAVILFLAALSTAVVRLKYSRTLYTWERQITAKERRAWYYNLMLSTDTHAKEVRLFGLGPLFRRMYTELRKGIRGERIRLAIGFLLRDISSQGGVTLVVYGAYVFIAFRALHGFITLGDLVMYFQAFRRGVSFMQQFLGSMTSIYEDNLFLANLCEFFDLKPKVAAPSQPLSVPRPMRSAIVFDNVSFTYPGCDREVLRDVNLTIRPGEVVALVGDNGAGKTTLIKLLCRLYDPTAGQICVDGIDLRRFDPMELRSEIGAIFQDHAHYNLSARENIWFGRPEELPDDDRIAAAAKRAGIHETIAALPHGYDTTLGKWFEDGRELSIGEWQKMALARAFLRDAQIMVLDEPTSAMDAKAEYEFFKKFQELAEGRATILISHRFSTVRMADRICLLSEGRVVENGGHDELIHQGGMYARLYETQAAAYGFKHYG